MKVAIYGYKVGDFLSSISFETEAEALSLKGRCGLTEKYEVVAVEDAEGGVGWSVRPFPDYCWTTNKQKAEMRNSGESVPVLERELSIRGVFPGSVGSVAVCDDGGLFKLVDYIDQLPEGIVRFPAAASEILGLLDGADSRFPVNLDGLLDLEKEIERRVIFSGPRRAGGYAAEKLEVLTFKTISGDTRRLWAFSEGYSEGYVFLVFFSEAEARKCLSESFKKDWTALECLECGSVFDVMGKVKPDAMGCEKCK